MIFATQVEEESSEDTVAAASNILDVTQDIGRSVASTLGRYCVDICSSLGRYCVDICSSLGRYCVDIFSENITLVWVDITQILP